jgi:hypothetical protein
MLTVSLRRAAGLGALHARRDAARRPPPGPALERPWPREVPIHEEMS